MIKRSALAVLATLAIAAPAVSQVAPDAMSLSDLITLLESGQIESNLLAQMVRDGCVSFPVDAGANSRLRAAGANDALIGAVRTACFTGAEVAVESQPSGAEVRINGTRVGATPWTGRFVPTGTMQITAVARGKSMTYSPTLNPRQRVRAFFGFTEDTLRLPHVRTVTEAVQTLQLERQFRPTVPEPSAGARHTFPVLFTLGLMGGGAALGGMKCYNATEGCWIEPDFDEETGEDLARENRGLVGAGVGFGVGIAASWVLGKIWDAADAGVYRRKQAQHAEWTNAMSVARSSWTRNHPAVLQAIADDKAARDRAVAQNEQIRARNRQVRRSSLTTEPLPGTPGS